MQNRSLRYLFLILALAWAGVIYFASSQPGTDTPMLFPLQDKLIHAVVFAILGFLAMGALEAAAHGYHGWQVWLIAALVTLYAMLDEFHQRFVPGRESDVFDVMADVIGGLLGIWVMYRLVKSFCSTCK
ncbi:VanZ family protein, partial [Crocinitomicaceae bacterium]|nr:VanZ family protein [Crocinitomicaceae bacterium]